MADTKIPEAQYSKNVSVEVAELQVNDKTSDGPVAKISYAKFPTDEVKPMALVTIYADFGNGYQHLRSARALSGQIGKDGKPLAFGDISGDWPTIGDKTVVPNSIKIVIEPIEDFLAEVIINPEAKFSDSTVDEIVP